MGNMPMPEGCTYEQMRAMYDVVNNMERKEYAVEQIAWYESMWRRWLPKYELAKKHKDEDKYAAEKYASLHETMKLLKEGIQFFREELTE